MLAVVDITGSMNTRDYQLGNEPVSRLAVAKTRVKAMVADLPCSSRFALALFAERVTFLLFEPVEVCANYGALAGTIDAIDWREAWEGDSHVASGLFSAVGMAGQLKTNLVFITDGQEAPPLPSSGGPAFDGEKGSVNGLIVGTGGYGLSPIPKFDERGREIGFWSADEVPHESRFGLPPPYAEQRSGYNPRNAPFGSEAAAGSEHLSSVRESYLQMLGRQTGLSYRHLTDNLDLAGELMQSGAKRQTDSFVDLRWVAGSTALAFLIGGYTLLPLRARFRTR
ncbi:vWA domain-containing protein [Labrys sp. WJW]|uniref:vWA domain-containing protein n=1 Tax=Labrys sp. WJW TaxID=1737983 RepID=UPI001FD8B204|nr:vWA domain-containing protein [Labrys sp. WJW]